MQPQANQPNPPAPSGTGEADRFEQAAANVPLTILPGEEQPAAGAAAPPPESLEAGWPRKIIEGIFTLPTAYVAARLGDYWHLRPEELSLLVDTLKPALDELIPWESVGRWGGVALALTMVYGPRLAEMQLRDRAEKAKRAGAGSAAETPNTPTAESAGLSAS